MTQSSDPVRRLSRHALILVGALLVAVAVACGGSSSDPTPVPTAAPVEPTSAPARDATAVVAPDVVAPQVEGAFAWSIEDVDAGAKPALALTTDGVPVVAYMLEAMPGFVKVATRNGSSWDVSTISEGYFYGPLDLAIGTDNVAHVTYHDHQDPSRFKPDKGDAVYAVLVDGEWKLDALFDSGHDGWDGRITVDPQGRPHISAIDPQEFGGDGVEYYSQDESGEWVVQQVGSGPLTYKFATAVAIDPQGNPHISYFDQDKETLVLASRDDSGWNISTVDDDGVTGLFSSMVIDGEGRFHISYLRQDGSSSGTIKYATRGPDETDWTVRQVDALDGLAFGFIGARNITSVALDSAGNPWIAYSDEKTLELAVWDGAGWQIDTVTKAGSRALGQLVSLKIDATDQPHIAYFEVTDKSPLNGRVKYAKGTRS